MAARCGAGPWGLIARDDATVHVAPWGAEAADGSESRPYRSLQRGADAAGGSGLVAVAAGTYIENVELGGDHDGVAIVGRCADLVVIDGGSADAPGIRATQGRIRLRGIAVVGGEGGIVLSDSGGASAPDVEIADVRLDRNEGAALAAYGAGTRVALDGVAASDTSQMTDGTVALGILVREGASLLARDVLVERAVGIGIGADGPGTSVDLEDATVRDTSPRPDGSFGRGIEVETGAVLVARRLLVERNSDVGIYVTGTKTRADVEDAIVRDTLALPDGSFGRGVEVGEGAVLVARRLSVEGNHEVGVHVSGTGTSVDLEDATVRDTSPRPDGTYGHGIEIGQGADAAARDLLVEGNHDVGLMVHAPETDVYLANVTIRDTQVPPGGDRGMGMQVSGGAHLDARGLLLHGNHVTGLLATGAGTSLYLEDAVVEQTQPAPGGSGGVGMQVQVGAGLLARRLLLEGNHEFGLVVTGVGALVRLDEPVVRGTEPGPDGTLGRGVGVAGGATLEAWWLLVEGNRDIGLVALDPGTFVSLQGATISGTRTAADSSSGFGVVAQWDAFIDASDLVVQDGAGPGLYVNGGGRIEAHGVTLLRNGFAGAVVFNGRLRLDAGTVAASVVDPSEAGGVGLFAWAVNGPPKVVVRHVAFSDLPGPALYLRGPGTHLVAGCTVQAAGTWPWLPGGVLAVDGVEPWHEIDDAGHFSGLLLLGNTFTGLPGDAVLLDASSATLAMDAETGAANAFSDLDGEPLLWQRCGAVVAPEILDGSIADPSCQSPARALGPLLEYQLWLSEIEPI